MLASLMLASSMITCRRSAGGMSSQGFFSTPMVEPADVLRSGEFDLLSGPPGPRRLIGSVFPTSSGLEVCETAEFKAIGLPSGERCHARP